MFHLIDIMPHITINLQNLYLNTTISLLNFSNLSAYLTFDMHRHQFLLDKFHINHLNY